MGRGPADLIGVQEPDRAEDGPDDTAMAAPNSCFSRMQVAIAPRTMPAKVACG
jgi:hypothetical protein